MLTRLWNEDLRHPSWTRHHLEQRFPTYAPLISWIRMTCDFSKYADYWDSPYLLIQNL